MLHMPPAQPGIPCASVHMLVQLPQWFTSVAMETSQPFVGSMSQSACIVSMHVETTHIVPLHRSIDPSSAEPHDSDASGSTASERPLQLSSMPLQIST
jgi:hypothetical protein